MAAVQGVYVAIFGRPADPEGLAYWNAVTDNGADLSPMIAAFTASQEFEDRFGQLGTEELIETIYMSLFGREPDPEGLAFYAAALESGDFSIESIAVNILDGASESDLQSVLNKVGTAGLFTERLDTPEEIAAYQGADIAAEAAEFLATVTSDPDSVPSQEQVDDAIRELIAGDEPDTPGGGGSDGVDTADPVFAAGDSTAFDVAENTGVGDTVYTADATDDSGSVTYSLSGDDADSFSIDADGTVSLAEAVDFDSGKTSYSFTIIAEDAAGNSAEQAASVTITESNDTGIFTVDQSAEADNVYTFNTIQAAVDAAAGTGSEEQEAKISIEAGTYEEQVTITSSHTDLVANGEVVITPPDTMDVTDDTVNVRGKTTSAAIQVSDATDVDIDGITIAKSGIANADTVFAGIAYTNATGDVTDMEIDGFNTEAVSQDAFGVFIDNATSSNIVNVLESEISGFGKAGIYAHGGGFIASDNTVTGNGSTDAIAQNGIVAIGVTNGYISYNTISEFGYAGEDGVATGIVSLDSAFSWIDYNTITNTSPTEGSVGVVATDINNDLSPSFGTPDVTDNTITNFETASRLAAGDDGAIIEGSNGNNVLISGLGADDLTGGAGADEFRLSTGAPDTIYDFETGTDTVAFLDGGHFTFANSDDTGPGPDLDASDFQQRADIDDLTGDDAQKLIVLTEAQDDTAVEALDAQTGIEAYVVLFNDINDRAEIYYTNGTADGDEQVAVLDSINTLADTTALGAADFGVWDAPA